MPGLLTVFSIPIYLRSPKRYYEEHRNYEEREIEQLTSYSGRSVDEEREKLEENPWLYDYLYFWPPWQFNDIVGYVVIYYDGRFYAESCELDRKRINRDPRHRRGSIKMFGRVGEKPSSTYTPTNKSLRFELLELFSQIKYYIGKKHWYIEFQYWEDIVASLDCKDFLRQRGASKNATL